MADPTEEMFFPGRGLWLTLAGVGIVDVVWLAASERLSVEPSSALGQGAIVAFVALLAFYCRSRSDSGLRQFAIPLTGGAFIIIAFVALRVLDHLTMSIPFPYTDGLLARLDSLLGFNWLGYAEWAARRPLLVATFQATYSAVALVTFAVFVGLFAIGRKERAREFTRLVFAMGLLTTVIGMFAPARAAMDRFASPELRAVFGPEAGIYPIPYLTVLRSHAPHALHLDALPGLVAIPSFHTVCALLVLYSCRGIPIARTAALLYAMPMIASTPIMGGHYFVDLIAGACLAAVVIFIDREIHSPSKEAAAPRSLWPDRTDAIAQL